MICKTCQAQWEGKTMYDDPSKELCASCEAPFDAQLNIKPKICKQCSSLRRKCQYCGENFIVLHK